MPQAVVVAAIPAVAAIAGGVIASKAQGRATRAQMEANDKAIAYQKEQQASRQSRYDSAYADYQKRYDAWLNQYFGGGGKAPANDGVHSSAAGIPSQAAAAGYVGGTPGTARASSIADLIAGQGQLRANAADQSGQLWGNTLGSAGSLLSKGIAGMPPKPIGTMQPGVDQPAPAPLQLAQAPTQANQAMPWNDWRNYGAGF